MNQFNLTVLFFYIASGCVVAEASDFVYGVSNVEQIQEHYTINYIGHSSASMTAVYEVNISDLEDEKCLFRNTLTSMTFLFNKTGVLVSSERIHKGNTLTKMKKCLCEKHTKKELTSEEKTFFGSDSIKYENYTTESVVFFTGSENTTRYSTYLKSKE